MILAVNINQRERKFEEILSRPAIYNRINCFPHEISAIKLASTARNLKMTTKLEAYCI